MFVPHFPLLGLIFSQAGSISRKDNLNKYLLIAGDELLDSWTLPFDGRGFKCRLMLRLPNGRQLASCRGHRMSFPLRGLDRFRDCAILELQMHEGSVIGK